MHASLSSRTPTSAPSTTPTATGAGLRRLVLAGAVLGIAWNVFGVVQWASSFRADLASLMAGGLTRAQAELYLALPGWMTAAFAIGVFAGLAGSLALLARRRPAVPVLGASLAAYVVLFAGDAAFGLFAAIPGQLAILSVVVAIALGLFSLAWRARSAGALR